MAALERVQNLKDLAKFGLKFPGHTATNQKKSIIIGKKNFSILTSPNIRLFTRLV